MKKSTSSKNSLEQRKKEHIELALQSRMGAMEADRRFYYEPLLQSHPLTSRVPAFMIAGKKMNYPIWVSSMTGGTSAASIINKRLAKVCKEFGLGMGLGSCRIILDQNHYFKDFDIRKDMGDDVPLFANLGIAQIEQIHQQDHWEKIYKMISRLNANGLIIHVNPLQEWLQPEGDRISELPIASIKAALQYLTLPIIVKEVGQGIGPESLKALMQLPLEAIEFAALGGTNFSVLELKRAGSYLPKSSTHHLSPFGKVGHTAHDMVDMVNRIGKTLGNKIKCRRFIISGGIENFLDGYYLVKKLHYPAVYGQASALLSPARKSYKDLYQYVKSQVDGLELAYNYLTIRG
ncbi:MAG: isopentenyl-diphosphate delta-isomerase [Saprospiraceae bacterium]